MLLGSTQSGFQQAFDRFSDACSVAGMKIRTTKTETMCLSRLPKQRFLQIGGVPLQQSEKYKYLDVSFTSDGRQNSELDIRIEKASAVMRQLHRSVLLKRQLCTKAKRSIFRSIYVPILTYGHECSIINEKVRSTTIKQCPSWAYRTGSHDDFLLLGQRLYQHSITNGAKHSSKTYRRARQRCFRLLAIISRPQIRNIHLPG